MDTAQRKMRKKTREGYSRGEERGGGVRRKEEVGVSREGVGVRREGFLFPPPLFISRHPPLSERLERPELLFSLIKAFSFPLTFSLPLPSPS